MHEWRISDASPGASQWGRSLRSAAATAAYSCLHARHWNPLGPDGLGVCRRRSRLQASGSGVRHSAGKDGQGHGRVRVSRPAVWRHRPRRRWAVDSVALLLRPCTSVAVFGPLRVSAPRRRPASGPRSIEKKAASADAYGRGCISHGARLLVPLCANGTQKQVGRIVVDDQVLSRKHPTAGNALG